MKCSYTCSLFQAGATGRMGNIISIIVINYYSSQQAEHALNLSIAVPPLPWALLGGPPRRRGVLGSGAEAARARAGALPHRPGLPPGPGGPSLPQREALPTCGPAQLWVCDPRPSPSWGPRGE